MVGWTTTVGVGCITSGEDSAAVTTGVERVVEALTRLTACCIIKNTVCNHRNKGECFHSSIINDLN